MSEICIIVTIVVYLAAMLLVGFAYSKTNNDSTDFYLGGRKMGPLVTAMSAEASDMSSWLLMGMPGLAYLTGIASPGWTAIGLALGTWLNWLIVARRLRRYSANLDAITVPQFLSLRFHDQRNLLNALGAVIIIVFFVPYTASGFAACGKLFHSLFGVDYMAAMLVSALVIVGYTILGGFRAVTTTDLIQSMVMSLALIAVLGYGIVVAGGWGGVPYSLRVAHSSVRAYRTPFAGIPERYFHRSDQEDYGTECGEDREFCGAYHSRSGQCAGNHCADVYHLLLPERVDGGYLCGLHRL